MTHENFIIKFLGHIINVKIDTNIVCKPLFKNKTYTIKYTNKDTILNYERENDSQGGH